MSQIRTQARRKITLGVSTVAGALLLVGSFPTSNAAAETTAPADGGDMTFLATHDWAAAQSTATGRRLTELEVIDGQVWAGYGDYGANTGPITMASYDTAGSTGFESAFSVDTEAIYSIRSIDGDVVAPATDPRSSADFAIGSPWRQARPLGAAHVFDAATLDGTDLWMVGSKGSDAVAWRSFDDGETWTEELRLSPDPSAGGYLRFYFAAVINETLYVQAASSTTGAAPVSKAFDGVSWSDAPTMLPYGGLGAPPVAFGDQVIYLSQGQGLGGWIHSFDGQQATELTWGYDIAVAGGKAWMLDSSGAVKSSTDLRSWTVEAQGPAGARSLAVDGQTVYVGTASSGLWSYDLGGDPAPDETTTTSTTVVEPPPTVVTTTSTTVAVEEPTEPTIDDDKAPGRNGDKADQCRKGWAKKGLC